MWCGRVLLLGPGGEGVTNGGTYAAGLLELVKLVLPVLSREGHARQKRDGGEFWCGPQPAEGGEVVAHCASRRVGLGLDWSNRGRGRCEVKVKFKVRSVEVGLAKSRRERGRRCEVKVKVKIEIR